MIVTPDFPAEAEPERPSQSVVERVAACKGVNHSELDPLFETIDPDALDRLVETNRHNGSALQVTFTYHGYEITVTGNGVVHFVSEEVTDG